jgi:hypothetical protein
VTVWQLARRNIRIRWDERHDTRVLLGERLIDHVRVRWGTPAPPLALTCGTWHVIDPGETALGGK